LDDYGLKVNKLEKTPNKIHAELSVMPRIGVVKRLSKPKKVMQGAVIKEPMPRLDISRGWTRSGLILHLHSLPLSKCFAHPMEIGVSSDSDEIRYRLRCESETVNFGPNQAFFPRPNSFKA
jgi:hypothetical protein